MKAKDASIWKPSHEKMVAALDREVNPERQIIDQQYLSEILENYFYENIYPEALAQIKHHAEHIKLLQPIIDSINERVADLNYYRNLLQEYRIESSGVMGFVERISFELRKRKKYEGIKEQYKKAHRDLLKLKIDFNEQLAQAPVLPKTHVSSKTEMQGNNLTEDELYEALWKNPLGDIEIEQRTGNCYYISTLLSLQSRPELAKEVLGSLVNEVQSGVFEVNFPGLPEKIEVTIHDILRYAAAGKIAKTSSLGNTILEVAFNEYHERVSAVFFHDKMKLGPRRFTEMKKATNGGDSADVMRALLGENVVKRIFFFTDYDKNEARNYLSTLDPERTVVTFESHISEQYVSLLRKKANLTKLTRSEQKVLDNPRPFCFPVLDFEGNEHALISNHAYAMIAIDQLNQTITLQDPSLKSRVFTLKFSVATELFFAATYATVLPSKQQRIG